MTEFPADASGMSDSDPAIEQRLANALADYQDLKIDGAAVDIGAYCGRFPAIEARLRRELEAIEEMDQTLGLKADTVMTASEGNAEKEDLPQTLSGLKIRGEVGSGGMGRVLLGYDETLRRTVAIKMLSQRFRGDEQMRTRFIQEAQAMAQLKHKNIVDIHRMGEPGEVPHFVMEYIQGADLIEATRPLPLRQKMELMVKVVRAVEVLHQHGIVHRDLKPRNILVGADLEPKVLDFGLAQRVDGNGQRLTRVGDVLGTPEYFSPEQAEASPALDGRSDIFSLGTILYTLLTGVTPFRADSYSDQIWRIREQDPVLPRRINPAVPGDLQNICLKALEKNPADRYGSALEMADDLDRYLAGEAVLASPTTYSRVMSSKVEQHLRELDGWKQDHVLSEHEFDAFQKLYGRLFDKEDSWILEVRRLAASQVTLYLGAWILVLGAALVAFFRPPDLSGTRAVLVLVTAAAPTVFLGLRCWKKGLLRIAIAYLLAFCLLLPTTFLVAFWEWKLLTDFTQGKRTLELFEFAENFTTNAQVWWALLLSLPAYVWLRRYTRATVFSLVAAVTLALLCLWTLLRMGLLDQLGPDPAWLFIRLIPIAAVFFILATALERWRGQGDSRYFYPVAVLFTFALFTGLALIEPNAERSSVREMLDAALPFTRGQHAYLFIVNAAYYLVLQSLAQGFGSAQMRSVAKAFRFVIPGHVMTSCLLLGIAATQRWEDAMQDPALQLQVPAFRLEARVFEILLPAVACVFVFWSIPKQMKNYLAMGLLFLAIGIGRLQINLFKDDQALWPLGLVAAGIVLMFVAANFAPIKLSLQSVTNFFQRRLKS